MKTIKDLLKTRYVAEIFIRTNSLCLSLGLCLLLTGCGLSVKQRVAIQSFGAATAQFGAVTADEFTRSRSDVVQMNELRRKLGEEIKSTEGAYTVDRVKIRVDAVNALKNYGELLNTLASHSEKEALQQASDSFVSNLRKVKGVNISDDQAGAIGQAVQMVGGLWVERQRLNAIRQIISTAHKPVLRLVDLVSASFDQEQDNWSLEHDATVAGLRNRVARIRASYAPNTNDLLPQVFIQECVNMAESHEQRFSAAAKAIRASCEQLRKAEINLKNLVQYSDFTPEDIDALSSSVNDFVQIYRILTIHKN